MRVATNLLSRVGQAVWDRRHPQWAVDKPGQARPLLDIGARNLPRYAFDRVSLRARNLRLGRQPWITARSLELLDQMLLPGDEGLEWGAGGTTPWFAARVASVISVEGFSQYYGPLRSQLDELGIDNVDLHLVSADDFGYESAAHREAYVQVRPDLQRESLDFVFVDGEYRDDCAARGLTLLRPGGMFILDNATGYLPADTRSPWKVARPATETWQRVADELQGWRRLWTTNGVWDTAIWFKP